MHIPLQIPTTLPSITACTTLAQFSMSFTSISFVFIFYLGFFFSFGPSFEFWQDQYLVNLILCSVTTT